MAATKKSAGDKARKTYETTDKSILASQTWQTVHSEVNLRFIRPVKLASSSAVRDVFQQDAPKGSLPARHSTVSFLGDARAGKTSLEKHLRDKSFDPAEEPTKGLEFDLVQKYVRESDGGWQAVHEGPYSKYTTGCAQYVALEIVKETESSENHSLSPSPAMTALLSFALPVSAIILASFSIGFQLGFGLPLILTMGIFKLLGQSYCLGINMVVIHIVVDFLHRYGLINIFCLFGNEQSLGYPYLQLIMFSLSVILATSVIAMPCIGGRPGKALAACLMCPPSQVQFDDLASSLHLTINVFHCLTGAALFGGIVASSSRCLVAGSLALLVTAWFLTDNESTVETLEYVLSLVAGFVMGVTGDVINNYLEDLCSSYRRGIQLQVVMGPIGFVYGIGLYWLFGWRMVLPTTWQDAYYIVPNVIAALLILQVERQRAYSAFQELGNYPSLLVGRSAKALKKVKDLPLKFTLIDFAGDAVYHCTHHLFLSNLSIHLIVFNMERLEQEPDYIRRICYWVQSVIVHVQNPNPHIFIVGTHRDSLPGDRSNFLSRKVSKALLGNEKFTQFIVGNPDSQNNIVFCVENSTPLRKDTQALLLRRTIMEVASSSFKSRRQVPIKWLQVSDFVSKYKSSSTHTCLMDKRTLFEKLRQEGVVEAEDEAEEFEKMLKFYDEIGEIKVMDDVVVLNLKALVQLVVELVELDCNDHELGIVHVSSLRRVWKSPTAENFLSIIALFERYDILCPISQEQFLVPLLLETNDDTEAKKGGQVDHDVSAFWDTSDSDTILYFKFYKFYPEAIFLRLLARCLSISQKTHDLGRGADRDVYRNVGRFYQGHGFYYKLELVCQSVEQNMIRVTVKCAPDRGPHSLLSRLHKDLQQIRDRDFPYLNYTVGLPCPVCRSFNNDEGEREHPPPHILRVAGHDEDLPLPGERATLMCRGKAFEVDLGKQQPSLDVAQPEKIEEGSKTSAQEGVRALLDPSTTHHLSILLDPPAPIFGNNWRALADELGLCFQDICYIETKHNPTEMVLEMYRKNTPTANRDQIHRALLDMDRPDAAELFRPSCAT